MIIGIHPDQVGQESYSRKWMEFLESRGIEVQILNLLSEDGFNQALECDGVMWRWLHTPHYKQSAKIILQTLEQVCNIPVYPNLKTAWHFDDKIAQYYLLKTLKAPIPDTWILWDEEEALNWVKTTDFPKIFKLSVGAGSTSVLKINDLSEANRLVKSMFRRGIFSMTLNEPGNKRSRGVPKSLRDLKQLAFRFKEGVFYIWNNVYPQLHKTWWEVQKGYIYFQEFLPDNDFDTRVTVVGNRAFAFRRENRPGDFRASGSGRIQYEPDQIDLECVKTAHTISEKGNFQSMAYDFLFKEGQPVIAEISYGYVDHAVYNCPGHWDRNLNWKEGSMWPEEAQVEDFLNYIQNRMSP